MKLILGRPHRRRRQGVTADLPTSFESRQLLAAVGNVPLGAVRWQSPDLEINDIRGAILSQGVVHIVGNEGGLGVRQLFTLESGSLTSMEGFWSQHVAQNGGTGGSSRSALLGIETLGDRRVIYLGASANSALLNNTPTYWYAPHAPLPAASLDNTGDLFTSTQDGIVAGSRNLSAAVGSLTQQVVNLPGDSGGLQILDSSSDGKFLVGPGIFRHTGPGELDYEIFSQSKWEHPPDALEFPTTVSGITLIGTQYFAAAAYVNSNFESKVGVWNVESGELLYVTEAGDAFAGIETVEGQLVLAVNGLDGGAIYAGLAPTRNDLSDELGTTTDTIVGFHGHGTLFGGAELGLVVNTGGYRVVSIDFQAPALTVAVASEVHQGNYSPNVLSTRERTFEVGLKGSATFDVTKVDKATLFVGDVRNTLSGRILSIRFTDENKDGFKDAVIKVQTSGAVRADTSRLKITGKTTTGDDFDGSRAVTMTAQSWQSHWQATSGANWRSLFDAYKRGLRKTWW